MVQVIKHGTKNIITCDYCGAELKYSLDDIKREEVYLSQIDSYTKRYIICPDCNNKIITK